MIVADASAVVELLLNTAKGKMVASHLFAPLQTIHVPHLIDVEVMHVLRRYSRTATLNHERALETLRDYKDLPLNRYPHDVLLKRMWELRHNFSAYDATYLALAEVLEAPLLTCDQALATGSGHGADVIVV